MNHSSKLKLTLGQRNGLKSFMEKTNDKTEYRRAQAIMRKCEGRTQKTIAMEHGVNERQSRDGLQIITKKELKD